MIYIVMENPGLFSADPVVIECSPQKALPKIPLDDSVIVHWHDTMCIEDIYRMIENQGKPGAIISSAYPCMESVDIPWYYLPDQILVFATDLEHHALYPSAETRFCFNFSINKKLPHRILLLKLIEYHDLRDYDYTWSGTGRVFDWGPWLAEMDQEISPDLKNHILSPVTIPDRFLHNNEASYFRNNGHITINKSHYENWNNIMHPIFSRTAVSLITESVWENRVINFTEKTLYSVLGLTLPIWVGGYQQALHWADHGFDVFEDVIDHDYQFEPNLIKRCLRAIEDNLEILRDIDTARDLRQKCMHRMIRNRDLMVKNLQEKYDRQFNSLPPSIRPILDQALPNKYKKGSQNAEKNTQHTGRT